VTVTPTAVDKTVAWGGTATATVTLKNTGGAPATVKITERSGGTQPLVKGGAQLNRVTGKFSNGSARGARAAAPAAKASPSDATPSDAPWTSIADYPSTIQDNAAAYYDGKIYSAFGYDGSDDTTAAYAFDPGTGSWSALASGSDAREAAAGAFIADKFYVSGGWGPTGGPDGKTEIYSPAGNTWSTGATNPKPHAAAGKAVLDNKLYLIGGCSATACGSTDVQVYDPATDSWSAGKPYPESISWQSCGTVAGSIYCAGGSTDSGSVKHAYVYDPGTQSWSPKADLPIDLWGSVYAAANGKLLVSGGVTADSSAVTNQGYAYDPAADSRTALPNANQTRYRAGGACGLYRVGGNAGGSGAPPVATAEVLPGYTECSDNTDVSWLSESTNTVNLQPGASAKVTVTLDAGVAEITQPATYTASLALSTDTPYPLAAVPVTMTVSPPRTWGKITGKVTSAVDGSGIAGATVQIDSWATAYTLKTAADGTYALWLDTRNNPLQLIAAKDGYQPRTRTVKINRTTPTTADFALKKS
jgi:N-acetylneuraminic acid mutarotase